MQKLSKFSLSLLLFSFISNVYTQEYSIPPYHGSTVSGDYLIDSSISKSYDRESMNYELYLIRSYYYTYDEYGHVTNKKEQMHFLQEGGRLYKYNYTFSYNSGYLAEVFDVGSQSYERYAFDENGNWIEYLYGKDSEISQKVNCFYTGSDLTQRTDSIFHDSELYEVIHTTYAYDSLSNLTHESISIKEKNSDDWYINETVYENTYSSDSLLLETLIDSNRILKKHFYSGNSRIKTLELKENTDTKLMTDTIGIREWVYDTEGNIIESSTYLRSARGDLYLNAEKFHYYSLRPSAVEQQDNSILGIKIYPNPVSSELIIERKLATEPALINIYNLSGQLVLQSHLSSDVIDISNIFSGVYILHYICGENMTSMKLLVE